MDSLETIDNEKNGNTITEKTNSQLQENELMKLESDNAKETEIISKNTDLSEQIEIKTSSKDQQQEANENSNVKTTQKTEESQDANSEPDNVLQNEIISFENIKQYKSEQTPQYFKFYVNLLNTKKQQKCLWDRTMGKRLQEAETAKDDNREKLKKQQNEEIKIKIEAAPFPMLPSRQQIESIIDEIDREIMIEKIKLKKLIILHNSKNVSISPIDNDKLKKGVVNKFGNLLSSSPYDQIKKQNKEKIEKSKKGKTLHVPEVFKRIGDLPHFFADNMEHDKEVLGHLISVKQKENEYHRALTDVYLEKREKWEPYSESLSKYHKTLRKAVDQWPPEFKLSILKSTNSSDITPYCAQDVLQYKTEEDKQGYLYYDENNLVEDPVFEHEYFKRRIGWTEEEKKIFLEKYAQHPKEFKKIANAIPGKCTKDVIEYYFINRIKLNLHEVKRLSRSKGHKKITTEGGNK